MPHKGKISPEEKLKAIEEYIAGKSIESVAKKCRVHPDTLRCWIRLYKNRGVQGLTPATKNRKYSAELKKRVVEDYLSGVASLRDICEKYDISRHIMLQKWIMCYNSHKDFKQPNSGGAIYMTKGRKTTQAERIEIVSFCISNGKNYGKTIEKYGVSYQQIYGWVKKYETIGADGLVDRRGKRKDTNLMTEVDKLRAEIKLKEAENLRLQMENDLLKKLDALERWCDTN